LLPHFVEDDFRDVVQDLRDRGYPLKQEWFAPHFEFRFPLYGAVTQRVCISKSARRSNRGKVLGEQGFAGATVRHVDSSLERCKSKCAA